jgi:putative ABC transport system permease protein
MVCNVAFTVAVVCNVFFIIKQRSDVITQATGLDEHALSILYSESSAPGDAKDIWPQREAELEKLKGIPGVKAVVAVDAFTFGDDMAAGVSPHPNAAPGSSISASVFDGSRGEVGALGIHILQGRAFEPEDYLQSEGGSAISRAASAILTEALATRLFGQQRAIGRQVYLDGGGSLRVIGIIGNTLRPDPTASLSSENHYVMLVPLLPDRPSVTYVLNTKPADRAAALVRAQRILTTNDQNRVLSTVGTFDDIRTQRFAHDHETVRLLVITAVALLLVTGIGIAGLANFWVQQRKRSIGVRRALGARKRDILSYFVFENLFIVSLGLALGTLAAFVLNQVLMGFFETDRLTLIFVPAAAAAVWTVGLLAVLAPALKASRLDPAIATKA